MGRVHSDVQGSRGTVRSEVLALVRRIPRGRVMTYGQISHLLASRVSPRAVGWVLHRCPEDVPWQRVVNASGGCSTDRLPDMPPGLQMALLEAEGVEFRASGRLDLQEYLWWPAGGALASAACRSAHPSAGRLGSWGMLPRHDRR